MPAREWPACRQHELTLVVSLIKSADGVVSGQHRRLCERVGQPQRRLVVDLDPLSLESQPCSGHGVGGDDLPGYCLPECRRSSVGDPEARESRVDACTCRPALAPNLGRGRILGGSGQHQQRQHGHHSATQQPDGCWPDAFGADLDSGVMCTCVRLGSGIFDERRIHRPGLHGDRHQGVRLLAKHLMDGTLCGPELPAVARLTDPHHRITHSLTVPLETGLELYLHRGGYGLCAGHADITAWVFARFNPDPDNGRRNSAIREAQNHNGERALRIFRGSLPSPERCGRVTTAP